MAVSDETLLISSEVECMELHELKMLNIHVLAISKIEKVPIDIRSIMSGKSLQIWMKMVSTIRIYAYVIT